MEAGPCGRLFCVPTGGVGMFWLALVVVEWVILTVGASDVV